MQENVEIIAAGKSEHQVQKKILKQVIKTIILKRLTV